MFRNWPEPDQQCWIPDLLLCAESLQPLVGVPLGHLANILPWASHRLVARFHQLVERGNAHPRSLRNVGGNKVFFCRVNFGPPPPHINAAPFILSRIHSSFLSVLWISITLRRIQIRLPPDVDMDSDFYLMRMRIQVFILCKCGSGSDFSLGSGPKNPWKNAQIGSYSIHSIISLWCGSGSWFLFEADLNPNFNLMRIQVTKLMRIHADPDSQRCFLCSRHSLPLQTDRFGKAEGWRTIRRQQKSEGLFQFILFIFRNEAKVKFKKRSLQR